MAEPAAAPPTPALAGTLLFTHTQPIVDCALTEAGNLVVLDSDGRVLCMQGHRPEEVTRLDLARPLGLTRLPEAKLAAVDGTGSIAVLAPQAAGAPALEHQRASTPISSYAVNPFGTMLALAAPSAHQVTLFFLASGKEQPIADDLGEISALAYSGDGRYLAAGNHAGEIRILDMARRQCVATLRPQTFEPGSVVAVCPGLEGGWVAAYENHDLACWTNTGGLHSSKKAPSAIACLAADPASGKIAFGNQRGYVRVYSGDLGPAVFAGQTHPKGVVRLVFGDEGRALVSAAKDGSVRRITLGG
jgi:hypothetical protein